MAEPSETPVTWPEKLREAARWFDTVDKLIAAVEIHDNRSGDMQRMVDYLGGSGHEIQDDLRQLADLLDGDAEIVHPAWALTPMTVHMGRKYDKFETAVEPGRYRVLVVERIGE